MFGKHLHKTSHKKRVKCPNCGHTYREGEPHPKARCQLNQATRKGHKYKAVKTVCSVGHPHPSGLECSVCEIMLARQRAGDIRNLKWQHTIHLAFGLRWKIDWSFEQGPQWYLAFAEAKGKEDRDYKLKLRVYREGGGPSAPIEIWKGTARRPMLVQMIHPKARGEK